MMQPVPAQRRRHPWLYHMTPSSNLPSIAAAGLLPRLGTSRFGPMSPEAQTKQPKVFYLPILGGWGMLGFLQEWWHGDVRDIALLRVPFQNVCAWQSADAYTARHEVWSYDAALANTLETRPLHAPSSKWYPLTS